MSVIILDGQLKSALSAVRSLGQKGVPVSAGAERKTGMALHSKHATARFVYPSPYTDQNGFIEAVKAEAGRIGGKPVIFAFSDATWLALYGARENLSDVATLVFPEEKSVGIAFDKAATYSLARVSGVPIITTHTPELREEIEYLGVGLAYPAVVKARRSVTWHKGRGVFGSASFVRDAQELVRTFFAYKAQLGESPLVQEFVRGEEYGVEMLAHAGRVFARVAHHRIRSLSPTGGASVLKETLEDGDLRHTMETYAEKLVKELVWSGPIMIEFKVDSDTKEPYLMEINGRFWGSLPLSVAAGVDMPHLFYDYAQGECHKQRGCPGAQSGCAPEGVVEGREGVVTRHVLGDVRHLLRVFFACDGMRSILYPKRLHALRDFFSTPKGTKSDVWSWSDPKPSIMEIIDIFKKTWKR